MRRLLRVALLAYMVIVNPLELILAQDDDLPYNPFIDKQLETRRTYENNAVRDLGGVKMDTVVGVPSEVRDDIMVIKKASAMDEKPVIILVYGRKQATPRREDVSEEMQRKEIERQALKEGLRDPGMQVRGDLARPAHPEVVQAK